jgi:hypothetical protein
LIRTLKVLISLLDKEGIGTVLVNDLVPEILQSYHKLSNDASISNQEKEELLSNSLMFFEMIDPAPVWQYMNKQLKEEFPKVR